MRFPFSGDDREVMWAPSPLGGRIHVTVLTVRGPFSDSSLCWLFISMMSVLTAGEYLLLDKPGELILNRTFLESKNTEDYSPMEASPGQPWIPEESCTGPLGHVSTPHHWANNISSTATLPWRFLGSVIGNVLFVCQFFL